MELIITNRSADQDLEADLQLIRSERDPLGAQPEGVPSLLQRTMASDGSIAFTPLNTPFTIQVGKQQTQSIFLGLDRSKLTDGTSYASYLQVTETHSGTEINIPVSATQSSSHGGLWVVGGNDPATGLKTGAVTAGTHSRINPSDTGLVEAY